LITYQTSRFYAHYVLAVLSASYVLNYLDRFVLTMLAGPIKAELGVSDGTMGFLLGPAFAVLYTGLGIPVARLADRRSRRNLIAAGMLLWSGFTALSGLARSAWQIAVARVGVGIGEAAGAAPAHSLIADYFPPSSRATALAVFLLGVPIGQMLGTLIGGLLVAPLGWRNVFLVVGLPGIAIAALILLTVREPARPAPPPVGSPIRAALELVDSIFELLRIRTFRRIAIGGASTAIAGAGFGAWLPEMFVRSHQMSLRDFGLGYGLLNGVATISGVLLGGILADRLGRRSPPARLAVAAASVGLWMPIQIAICAVPNPWLAIALSVPSGVVGSGWGPILFAVAQSLAPARYRAVASSVLILFLTGGGAGPWAIGVLSDLLTPRFGGESLRVAMIAVLSTMTIGIFALLAGARSLMSDLERATPTPLEEARAASGRI
jgi:MFS family permease